MLKKKATATACFLVNCFYRDNELIGKSLTGKNNKPTVDADILSSIMSKYLIHFIIQFTH